MENCISTQKTVSYNSWPAVQTREITTSQCFLFLFFSCYIATEQEFLKEERSTKRGRPRLLSVGDLKPACTVCERCELSSGAVQCVKVVAVLWTEAVITAL